MDARQVLGVGPRATAADVRRAYEDLARRVDPRNGGSAELLRVVAAAYEALTRQGSPSLPTIDPYRLFGLDPLASVADIKVAYRRLAAIVHPDRGGTDELFRIVSTSYDLVLNPYAFRRQVSQPRHEPWPRPAPERPFRPPPPEERPHRPGWQDWLAVGVYAGAVAGAAGAAVLAYAGFRSLEGGQLALPLLLALALALAVGFQGRVVTRGLLRALVRARASYLRHRGADPEQFLTERCLDSPVNREREDLLYAAYLAWARDRGSRAVSTWVFIEKLRTLGLLHVQSSSLEHGLFVGVRLREA